MNHLLKVFKKESIDFNLSNKYFIVIVLISALLLFFSSNKSKNTVVKDEVSNENIISEVSIENSIETKLKEILSKIKDAGEVDVLIYYSSYGEKIIASNKKDRSEKTEKGDGMIESTEDKEVSAVLYGTSSDEKPFITEEKSPKPGGIIVLAEGAENEKVCFEIKEAVKALLGIAPNRIKVSVKSKNY